MEKVIDIEERIPSMRKKRRKKTNRKFILVLLIFVAALLILLYFQSHMSKIDDIELNATALHEREHYLKIAGLSEGDALWGFNANEAAERIAGEKSVKKAAVKRKWIRTVSVSVEEWKPVALAEVKGTFDFILENGEAFTPDAEAAADIPIATGFDSESMRKQLASQLLEMDPTVYQLISEVQVSEADSSDRVILYMDDGYEVHASLATLADKLSYYPDIVNELTGSEKGIIDMEVGTYFTPYSKSNGEPGEGEEVGEGDEGDGTADSTEDTDS